MGIFARGDQFETLRCCVYVRLTMNLVSLALVLCCAAAVVNAQRTPDIRRISILELLQSNPQLKEELAAKIKAEKKEVVTTRALTTAAPTTAAPTTTPAPQADSPPAAPAEATTPAAGGNGRRRGNRRGNGGRRRRPASVADAEPNHRLRVVKEEEGAAVPAPGRSNGRRFPGAS